MPENSSNTEECQDNMIHPPPPKLQPSQQKDRKTPAMDKQIGGKHYKQFKIQPLDFVFENNIPACEASILKYVVRHKFKNGAEDLQKAKHLIDYLLEKEYGI